MGGFLPFEPPCALPEANEEGLPVNPLFVQNIVRAILGCRSCRLFADEHHAQAVVDRESVQPRSLYRLDSGAHVTAKRFRFVDYYKRWFCSVQIGAEWLMREGDQLLAAGRPLLTLHPGAP